MASRQTFGMPPDGCGIHSGTGLEAIVCRQPSRRASRIPMGDSGCVWVASCRGSRLLAPGLFHNLRKN